jgi:plastocyanin
MRTTRLRAALAAALLAACVAGAAHAGQVRVNVSSNSFSPPNITINAGDHVVWVWESGIHSVTSGDDGSVGGSGLFNSGTLNTNTSPVFSWRSGAPATVPYYCFPHFSLGMVGNITVAASGAPVADFRISEVQFNVAGGQDLIEIANIGAATGSLGRYRISVANGVAVSLPDNITVAASGGRVVIHVNAMGTNTATDFFVPALPDLPVNGSATLYVPNTVAPALTNTNTIIDFVQWGAGGQPNEATAVSAGYWTLGQAITGVAAGHSIELCSSSHGLGSWAEVATPTFGSNGNCATPAGNTTWGRIKTLYR